MALGRNHRIFNIGNSSGSYGISRVYHDETLSGDGTLSSLLGVVGGAGDAEVNEFVYNNSGDIINVDNVVQTNSANWNDISAYQENSGSYQPSGNYIPYTAAFDDTFKTNSALWFQRPNGDTQSNYINYNTIQLRNVIDVSAQTGAILTYNFLRFETYSDSAYVDKDKIHKWDNVSDYTQNNSANWNEVSSKLDASAFDPNEFYPMTGNPSGFLTAVDLSDVVLNSAINYYRPEYGVSGISGRELYAISSKYAALDEHGHSLIEPYNYINNNSARIGDVVLNYEQTSASYVVVNNNSANWNDISAYQQNSASYLTAHQSLDGYATTAWVEEQGYLTAHQDISNKLDASAFSDVSGTFLTAVPAGYATTGEVNSVSSILSAAIDAQSGNVYTGIDPIVVNNDDKAISANTWAFSAGNGVSFVDDNVNKITRIDVTAAGGNPEVESYVVNNSATIDDVNTTYQTNSGSYLTAHQSLDGYATTSELNSISSYFSGAIDYVSANAGGSTSGFVSGTNVVFVPNNEWTTEYGTFYSANVSGDISVSNGSYFNNGEYIVVGDTYSLSAIGTQINNKVDLTAYNQLKTSYDALSSNYATLSSLFATYSGQWLLPNTGV